MKNLLLLLITFGATFSFAQTIDIGTRWTHGAAFIAPSPNQALHQYIDVIGRDTIDNEEYFLLTNYEGCGPELTHLRIEEKKYFIRHNGKKVLLYDFNLGVGDTLRLINFHEESMPDQLYYIDSVSFLLLGNDSLKQQHISYTLGGDNVYPFGDVLTEKVGSDYFFVPQLGFCDPGAGAFRCVQFSDGVSYKREGLDHCEGFIDYEPFVKEGKSIVVKVSGDVVPDPHWQGFYFSGDSIYNGITYKKVYEFSGIMGANNTVEYSDLGGVAFLVREDILERQVFAIATSDLFQKMCSSDSLEQTDEILLYDFSLEVGDKTYYCNDTMAVQELSIVNQYEKDRTMWVYEFFGSLFHVVEGVGNTFAPFHPMPFFPTANFSQSVQAVCCGDDHGCLIIIDAVQNPLWKQPKKLEIFPSPATNTITIGQDIGSNARISIIDISGQVMLEAVFENSVDVSGLAAGSYFVRIVRGPEVFTGKFIKIQ